MRNFPSRRITVVSTVLFLILLGFAPPARAQNCPAGPFPGTVVMAAPVRFIFPDGFGVVGDNLVEIPGMSPVNSAPADPTTNGFVQLCTIFGLIGTKASVSQSNASNSNVTTFYCDQRRAPPFQPCQAVMIKPDSTAAMYAGAIPFGAAGVEGTWSYRYYQDGIGLLGDNLFGIPYTAAIANAANLCTAAALPANTSVSKFNAANGTVSVHICGQVGSFALSPGEAVLVRPTVQVTSTLPIP